ncbi:zinc-ribbon domain-containing protein [Thalassoglobus sp. JC818]|uniref:zinc-ribbon domain-containing protein n=1 Tax=Thalassoglobus sp. JC818 TaxID=3232136 RepID=UPI00345A78BC
MSDEEKVAYLANLVAVSRVDGSVSPNETHAIELAQKHIGAKKTALRKADTLAQSEGFAPTLVGSFSVRIANLEDMISVSLADGVFEQTEKSVVLEFAKKIGITNEQLQLILAEVRSSLKSESASRACPNCSASVSRDAKFCPECGSSLELTDSAAAVAVEYSIPRTGIAVEFSESTAAGFADAVKKAKLAPENAECVKGKKTWYMAAWPKEQISEAAKLAKDLKGMRNRKVWVDSLESRWDDVFGFIWCSENRDTAYRPFEYCFGVDEKRLNTWGCKNARMDWTKWSEWFSYGSFKKGGLLKTEHEFVFDKKRIRHELETNLFRYRFCPHLNFKLIEAVLEILPDQVKVNPNGDWTFKREYEELPGSIKIKEKVVENGFSYTDEYYSSGVEPRTPDIGLAILKKAFAVVGGDPSGLKGLLTYRSD